nr:ACSLC-C-like protein [Parasacculina yatsui]
MFERSLADRLASACVLAISPLAFFYDVITLPLYALLQRPWQRLKRAKQTRACAVNGERHHIRNVQSTSVFHTTISQHRLDTVDKIVKYSVDRFGDRKCFGTRRILSVNTRVQSNGTSLQKLQLGEYDWVSYREFASAAEQFARALSVSGVGARDRIALYAETRYEWMVVAIGAFMRNVSVVTVYTTLSSEAVVSALNQTLPSHVFTSQSMLNKMSSILPQCHHVRRVVCMNDQTVSADTASSANISSDSVSVLSLTEFMSAASAPDGSDQADLDPPARDDVAIIMYTSGSTGAARGVMISHYNIVSAMAGFAVSTQIDGDDLYIAYLPLAHVMEIMAELCCVFVGVPVGYSSPLTLLDTSGRVDSASVGDCTQLRPTLMAAVPAILERIRQGIFERGQRAGPLLQRLLHWAIEYRCWWKQHGFDTPLLHRLCFHRVSMLLGGRVRALASGGAPLSPSTHRLVGACLGVSLVQGYGLTETTGSATLMDDDDLSVGRVGHPLIGCDIRLVDWPEGEYRVTDSPNPRGEIVVGGDTVASGYWGEINDRDTGFYTDSDGVRWFHTGDIGEIFEDGTVKIIDRKKDIIKLQHGEYVAPSRVETALLSSPLVDAVFIHGTSLSRCLVAIVVPNRSQLHQLAWLLELVDPAGGDDDDWHLLCESEQLVNCVLQRLVAHGKTVGLSKFELPASLILSLSLSVCVCVCI